MELLQKRNRLTATGGFVLLFCMLYVRLFRPIGFTDDVWKLVFYPVLLYLLAIVSKGFFKSTYVEVFSNPIRIFTGIIVLSSIVCMLTWGQNILDTLVSCLPYFSFLLYFYLLQRNLKLKETEYIIWWFTAIFILCFYLALAAAPTRLFLGYGEIGKEIDTDRGLSRIRLTLIGGGPLYLAFFLAINKLKTSRKKWKWISLIVLFFLTIVLQLGRQAIVISSFLGILLYLKEAGFGKKLVSILVLSGLIFLLPIIASNIFQGLQERTNQELESQEDGEDNVRIAAYKFYFNDVSRNILNDLFGNGMFSLGKSRYGDFVDKNGRSQGMIPADVGYASIFLYFGAVGLLFFFIILYRVIRLKVPPTFSYAKYYIYFLFLGNIAGSTLLGTIPTLCLALYILSKGQLFYQAKLSNMKISYAKT
ncbi:hypothetical protein [Sphingobacterium suaedae]|uniref:O-antigen ligase domain-containing protein n=1 Tax=Sphingobacterium suaedae TaxID=1686402 RepID=A0ABW5KNV2_9SPHI